MGNEIIYMTIFSNRGNKYTIRFDKYGCYDMVIIDKIYANYFSAIIYSNKINWVNAKYYNIPLEVINFANKCWLMKGFI